MDFLWKDIKLSTKDTDFYEKDKLFQKKKTLQTVKNVLYFDFLTKEFVLRHRILERI